MGENAVKHTFKSCERFKDAPPEGGWGFVVMLGLAFSFVSIPNFTLTSSRLTFVFANTT